MRRIIRDAAGFYHTPLNPNVLKGRKPRSIIVLGRLHHLTKLEQFPDQSVVLQVRMLPVMLFRKQLKMAVCLLDFLLRT